MEASEAFLSLAIAVGLGLLVGLQRERTEPGLAGVRTFPIIAAVGAVCALLGAEFGGWVIAAGLLGVAAVVVVGMLIESRLTDTGGTGVTTEMSILLMFAIGALAAAGRRDVAVAMGGALAVLLHAKSALHRFAGQLGEKDVHAVMQFSLITLVILPVLPDETFGPLDVLNPRAVWVMVVLVVGINLGAYIAYKALGRNAGVLVAGLLGGAISSTATTASASRRAHTGARSAVGVGCTVVTLASAVVFVRVLIEIAVVSPGFFRVAAPPVLVMLAALGVAGLAAWWAAGRRAEPLPEPDNPAELGAALLFAALFAGVLLAVAAAERWFPTGGVYAVATLSGLTDMDAITLSTSRLVADGRLDAGVGWRAILLASVSNLVFKAGIVAFVAGRRMAWRIAALFGAAALLGLAMVLFWPETWEMPLGPAQP